MTVLLSEIEKMTPEQWRKCVEELSEATHRPVDGAIKALNQSIAVFEQRLGMTSDLMRERVFHEELDETRDICEWLMQVNKRDRLVRLLTKSID